MRVAKCLPVLAATLMTATGVGAASAIADAAAARSSSGCAGIPAQARLSGVAATSASDAWSVGVFSSPKFQGHTLVMHWNGIRWCRVASPNVGTQSNYLNAVTAISPADAWAVGAYHGPNGSTKTLIEHWDGGTWSVVPSPNFGLPYILNYLTGIAARSPSDAWAVGNYAAPTGQDALILHWNGTTWKQAASPNPLMYNYLRAVSAARFGVWAVGFSDWQTFTVHRIGTSWIQSPSPVEPVNVFLNGLAMTSRYSGWAVGSDNSPSLPSTLILRWNGAVWAKVASPKRASDGFLYSVSTTSASNAWAVGQGNDLNSASTMILHWNGRSWTRVAAPDPGGGAAIVDALSSVAATSRANAWAVGYWSTSTAFGTMILHWNGMAWTVAAKA